MVFADVWKCDISSCDLLTAVIFLRDIIWSSEISASKTYLGHAKFNFYPFLMLFWPSSIYPAAMMDYFPNQDITCSI